MTRAKAEGTTALILNLQEKFPNAKKDAINLIAVEMLNYIAEGVGDGWTVGLAKVDADGTPKEMKFLELKDTHAVTLTPLESLFFPKQPSPKGRKLTRRR